jgi:hypothetical protein
LDFAVLNVGIIFVVLNIELKLVIFVDLLKLTLTATDFKTLAKIGYSPNQNPLSDQHECTRFIYYTPIAESLFTESRFAESIIAEGVGVGRGIGEKLVVMGGVEAGLEQDKG